MIEQIERFLGSEEVRMRIGGSDVARSPSFVFPGSFAPLHAGHLAMSGYVEKKRGADVDFEISVTNVDKPTLSGEDIQSRLRQFDSKQTVWLTKAATFAVKATLFPDATFLLGADTLQRLLDKKYYRDENEFDDAMRRIVQKQCRLLVFGRMVDGVFASEREFSIPDDLRDRMEFVPESEFRCDISSSEIRGMPDADGQTKCFGAE